MGAGRWFLAFAFLLLLIEFSPIWAHEGVIHADGSEIHPRLEILAVGASGQFKITVAQLPDTPLVGDSIQFLMRLEENAAIDDPLLGGLIPFLTPSLQVWFTQGDGSNYPVEVNEEGTEAGVHRFQHVFSRAGEWKLNFEFEDDSGTKNSGEMTIPLEAKPTYWSMLFFQATLFLVAIGLVIQRFRTNPAGSSIFYSVIVLGLAGVVWILANSLWDTTEIGILEVAALNPPVHEPHELQQVYRSKKIDTSRTATSLRAFQSVSSPRVFSGVVRHATNRINQVRSPLPGIVSFTDDAPKIGDQVQKGQILGVVENHFNTHDYSHLLNQRWELQKVIMETSEIYAQLESDYQQGSTLLDLGVLSSRAFESLEKDYRAAKIAAERAREKLTLHDSQLRRNALYETQLVAPISGTISQATYSAGQMVYENDPIFEIVDPSIVWVEVYALPQDLHVMENQSDVTLRSIALRQIFAGRLVEIRPDVDEESKALRVLYEVSNPEHWLKPGMLVNVYPEDGAEEAQQAKGRDNKLPESGN